MKLKYLWRNLLIIAGVLIVTLLMFGYYSMTSAATIKTYATEEERNQSIFEHQVDYHTNFFHSTDEFKAWVAEWEVRRESVMTENRPLSVSDENKCEDYAFAMMVDALKDGYWVTWQIETSRNHMVVMTPIFKENKWLFADPQKKKVTEYLNGRKWRID